MRIQDHNVTKLEQVITEIESLISWLVHGLEELGWTIPDWVEASLEVLQDFEEDEN